MRKLYGVLICTVLLQMNAIMLQAKEDEHTTVDGNGNIVTDLPWNQEIEGKMYGKLIGNVNDDIDIDIPEKEEPGNDDKGSSDKNKPDDKDNSQQNNQGTKPSGNSTTSGSQGGNAVQVFRANIARSNQSSYGIKENGTDKAGITYYKWEEKQEKLTIFPALFEKAKEEKKNIVMRVVDRGEGKMHYRLRVMYDDIKDMDIQTLTFEFGARCVHKENLYDYVGTSDIIYLLQCKQEQIPIPVYIGIGVPATWNHDYGVYQYSYAKEDLIYIRKDLQIDEENIVEVKMNAGQDYVFAEQSLPIEGKNAGTWIAGLTGNSHIVKQGYAIGSTALLATAGFLGVSLASVAYMKKSGKGSWGKKRRKES